MEFTALKIKTFLSAIIAVITVFMYPHCAPDIAGGGSEAGNARITGMVTDAQGSPVAKVIVQIMPSDFNPVKDAPVGESGIDTTDADGLYHFKVTKDQLYTIQALHMESRERGLLPLVEAYSMDDTAPLCILQKPGALRVMLPFDVASRSGYLYIPGTTFHTRFDETEDFVFLDSIPAGIIPSLSYSSDASTEPVSLDEDITIPAGDTVTIAFHEWAYSRTIILNTSVTGADIRGDVYRFPVLIRLNSGNFDFTQAENDGGDILFSSLEGAILPHEVERWDGAGGHAELWVLVDSIRGDDSTQSIVMHWGNPDAAPVQNSGVVFDTAAGFQGVWHLGDATEDGTVLDATVNRYHGVSPDTAQPQAAEGVAGNCRVFDGVADFITMPNTSDGRLNFPEEGLFTLSAWVKLDTLDGEPHLIVAKGFTQYFMRFTYFPSDSPTWEFSEFSETGMWHACTTSATSGEWALLTGVRDGSRQLLYYNGIFVDSTPNSYPNNNFSRDVSNDLSMGKFLTAVDVQGVVEENYCFFKGSIDEVRIISSARSSDWVRLCYMNQRSEDRLVVLR